MEIEWSDDEFKEIDLRARARGGGSITERCDWESLFPFGISLFEEFVQDIVSPSIIQYKDWSMQP